jgi:3-deoxy-D-arabino-heptulosonate 7-phosphate (DAHP) synthase
MITPYIINEYEVRNGTIPNYYLKGERKTILYLEERRTSSKIFQDLKHVNSRRKKQAKREWKKSIEEDGERGQGHIGKT